MQLHGTVLVTFPLILQTDIIAQLSITREGEVIKGQIIITRLPSNLRQTTRECMYLVNYHKPLNIHMLHVWTWALSVFVYSSTDMMLGISHCHVSSAIPLSDRVRSLSAQLKSCSQLSVGVVGSRAFSCKWSLTVT